jgi:hypothetical protein
MTAQSDLQRDEQIQALLAQSRQVASDETKGSHSRFAAEGGYSIIVLLSPVVERVVKAGYIIGISVR